MIARAARTPRPAGPAQGGFELRKRREHAGRVSPAAPPRPPLARDRWTTLIERRWWCVVLLMCLPAIVPTLLPGWFEGHDDLHIYRLIEYDLALRDGQVPPRWFPDVSAGYGNPHPIYYAPLFYMVAELFHLAGLGLIGALKGAIVVFMLLAAIWMFQYARLFWGPAAALVAAAAYTYAPYHLLDVYVRKALSEFTVFTFLPALLLAFHNLRHRGSRWDVALAALATAAMSTSHTITTMMVPPLLGAYTILLSSPRAGRSGAWTVAWLWKAAVATTLGYALAGFFLVPAFLERGEINLDTYTKGYVDYHKHFVHPLQLIWWPWGFGMSVEGLKDRMSFRMGLPQITGAVLAAIAWSRLRRRQATGARHVAFYLGVTVVAVFMMVPASTWLWDMLAPLRFVQFPWRFLTLTTLSTGFLCGAAFSVWGPAPATGSGGAARRRLWAAALACAAAMAAGSALGGTLGVNLRIPASRLGFEEKPYNSMIDRGPQAEAEPMDGAFVNRHTLRWIDHLPQGVSFRGLDETDTSRPRVQVERGPARVRDLRVRTWRIDFLVEADAPARLRVNTYRFPGWTARVDGAVVPLQTEPRQRRVLFFDVAAGAHDVEVVFERTWPRRLGDGLTLAGLAALAAMGLWPEKRRRNEAPPERP